MKARLAALSALRKRRSSFSAAFCGALRVAKCFLLEAMSLGKRTAHSSRTLVPLDDEKAVLYFSLAVMLFLRDERREVLGSRRRGGSSADALIASPDLLA
jgi:hypothetical protein